jgi:hypothetical protein
MRRLEQAVQRFSDDERGLSTLMWLGIAFVVVSLLAMIPFVRDLVVDIVGIVFDRRDDAGELIDFSVAMRGIFIAVGAVLVFIGAVWLVLYTDVGARLGILLTGAALFGWLTINGILFTVFAPRGIRPESLEGLDAFEIRVPAIAMTLGSFVLFVMFLIALDRYEKDPA